MGGQIEMTETKQPKLIIEKNRKPKGNLKLVYLHEDVHSSLKQLSQETNIPMAQLIDRMLIYALKYTEVQDLQDDSSERKD